MDHNIILVPNYQLVQRLIKMVLFLKIKQLLHSFGGHNVFLSSKIHRMIKEFQIPTKLNIYAYPLKIKFENFNCIENDKAAIYVFIIIKI